MHQYEWGWYIPATVMHLAHCSLQSCPCFSEISDEQALGSEAHLAPLNNAAIELDMANIDFIHTHSDVDRLTEEAQWHHGSDA